MIRKLWLVFCQTATVCVAALFVVTTLRPDLLAWTSRGGVVTIRESPPESFKLPEIRGALITEVFRGTPADKAGIKLGDILIAVEGSPVTDSSSMLNLIAALNPGRNATLKVVRSQHETDVKVVVGRRPLQQRQGQ